VPVSDGVLVSDRAFAADGILISDAPFSAAVGAPVVGDLFF
jgi:hypothetical protein